MIHSSDEMYTGGKYLEKNPRWNEEDSLWKAGLIYGLMQKNQVSALSIVEVGCGAGGILEALARTDLNVRTLEGYDISAQAISLAMPKQNERIKFFNQDYLRLSGKTADVILVIDVVEHIDDIYGFLRKLKKSSSHFIFHIPLDLCCRTLLKPHVLLQQRESVGHIHYFSKDMVRWLLNDTGYQVIDWFYTKPLVDERAADSFKRKVKKRLRNLSFRWSKDMSAALWGGYSMMILAK